MYINIGIFLPPASTLDEGLRQAFRTMNSHLLVVSDISTRRKARKLRRIRRDNIITRRSSRDRTTIIEDTRYENHPTFLYLTRIQARS